MTGIPTKCTRCGNACVLGVNAIEIDGNDVCDTCAHVKRGFANSLLPEEREALRETLSEDIRLRRIQEFKEDFTALLMKSALEDAQ